jgi:integrase
VLTEAQYQALLEAATGINWRVRVALVLANETGHHISAIRHLRWLDVDLERERIRWRAEHDKIGFAHVTPMSPTLLGELRRVRQEVATIGDAWVVPAVRDPSRPCSRGTLDKWLQEARRRTTVPLPPRAAWHCLRLKFATEMQDLPLKELCYLGGWKDAKTLLECYQQPDETVMRRALARRRRYGQGGVDSGSFNRHHCTTPDLPVLRKHS